MSSTLNAPASPSTLRVGLIGCGKMGLHHLKAIRSLKNVSVVGVADPAASIEELAPLLATDAVVTASVTDLLERTRPDIVHIVTPPGSHAALAEQAINAGCHIYVEKPFTLTRKDADRVISLAAERGVLVCAGHQVLFEPPALAVAAALGSIGQVSHIESHFSFRMVRRTITRVDQTKDILPHAIYPVVEYLRKCTGLVDVPIGIVGLSVDASGEVYAILRLGQIHAVVLVTLNGRPVEQFHQVAGTNGSLRADGASGATVLIGPGAGPGSLFTPFRRGFQNLRGGTSGFVHRVFQGGSYPGLAELLGRFYDSVRSKAAPPLSPQSILDTVDLCERIGEALDAAESVVERRAQEELASAERRMPAIAAGTPLVLVTGGTGLLGRQVSQELRSAGFPVRVVARRTPAFSSRVAGVEYVVGDLARGLAPSILEGVGTIVHCAAETAGGKSEHQKNSIDATRLLITGAVAANVRRMIHVSSIAVLKTSRSVGGPVDEMTPVDPESASRGPYVWGKAESEVLARQLSDELKFPLKIVRPGPLVDYRAFEPPGRLGREVGTVFVAMGPKRGLMSVCDVSTAARVIRSYVQDFESAPAILNLVDASAQTRRDLLARFLTGRPDLKVWWIPAFLLRAMSGPLKLVQRIALGSTQPVDVAAAFASEQYQTGLAASTIARAGETKTADAKETLASMDASRVSG